MNGDRCAERPGTSMLLWQHEFYFVLESDGRRPPKPYVYQALEFRKGSDLPEIEQENMSRKQLHETWVLGVAYAPALVIRKYSTRLKGYLFHTEFNDTDARTGLFWKCPELVRIDNSVAWRAMSKVLTAIPRVVHPDDVYSGAVHVAGRDLHYVCGMCAHENVVHSKKKGQFLEGSFDLQKLIREEGVALAGFFVPITNGFCMYAEERLGQRINSAGIMWEMIEEVFDGIRTVMSGSGRARSGSFKMMWSASLMDFWESLTVPDSITQKLVDKVTSRCDALFKQEKHHVDVHRKVLTYRTRSVVSKFFVNASSSMIISFLKIIAGKLCIHCNRLVARIVRLLQIKITMSGLRYEDLDKGITSVYCAQRKTY